jgi:hypothetical protein
MCCALLDRPVRPAAHTLAVVLARQAVHGRLSRAPVALPDSLLTRRALQIIAALVPPA